WLFAALCLIIALFLLRLVLTRRVTLQGSLSFLVLLAIGAAFAVFPGATAWIALHLGFQLPANFFFAVSLAALAALHVHALVMQSRVQLRSISLTQELAILQERIDRMQRELHAQQRKAS